MANSPIEPEFFDSFDGARIAWRELGEGRVVVLLHGFFSDAQTNWIRYGHAAAIAARGFRVIMPDLRAHGSSAKPHDAGSYPPDVLAKDGFALIEHLGLSDYDLGGYSLGARTVVRMMVQGATPRRIIVSGMGLQGLMHTAGRGGHFRNILTNLGTFERGTAEWLAEAFLKTSKGDPEALLRILDTFVDTPVEAIRAIVQPALILSGEEDDDNGSAEQLADTLPDALYRTVPGGHMSAVVKPELGQAIADFLAA
ncbi:MAG: alpha/beta fold hydrolase [Pseudomonadota bacterium]|uniref:alpha/beta fold hydrolase n=1 Tax=Sphingomonas sp. ERG5 TaxID=1381597 RepID=UPI00054BF5D4|nr:alpha/beta fold hydrolase [Sphingomonas sp. ERG5]